MNALGIVRKPQLGGDVDAYCGKCKETREHVIAALNPQGGIDRVQCRTCQSNHVYREKKVRSSSPRGTTRGRKKEVEAIPDETGPLRVYSMNESFNVGDRVDHPKFGIGVVVEVRMAKIDVKFGRELKVLVHAGWL